MAYRGKYKPVHPDKYQGDPTKITYRSLWERKCMKVFDSNPNVIMWSSEEISVPYVSPVDGKRHKYYPDFLIELKNNEGKIQTLLIEVKPDKQTTEPKKPKSGRVTQRYITEVKRYAVNAAKWDAAKSVCENYGWQFRILTEKDIF